MQFGRLQKHVDCFDHGHQHFHLISRGFLPSVLEEWLWHLGGQERRTALKNDHRRQTVWLLQCHSYYHSQLDCGLEPAGEQVVQAREDVLCSWSEREGERHLTLEPVCMDAWACSELQLKADLMLLPRLTQCAVLRIPYPQFQTLLAVGNIAKLHRPISCCAGRLSCLCFQEHFSR